MHGGAAGSGAPKNNSNALKGGGYTREALEWRRKIAELMRVSRQSLLEMW